MNFDLVAVLIEMKRQFDLSAELKAASFDELYLGNPPKQSPLPYASMVSVGQARKMTTSTSIYWMQSVQISMFARTPELLGQYAAYLAHVFPDSARFTLAGVSSTFLKIRKENANLLQDEDSVWHLATDFVAEVREDKG